MDKSTEEMLVMAFEQLTRNMYADGVNRALKKKVTVIRTSPNTPLAIVPVGVSHKEILKFVEKLARFDNAA